MHTHTHTFFFPYKKLFAKLVTQLFRSKNYLKEKNEIQSQTQN